MLGVVSDPQTSRKKGDSTEGRVVHHSGFWVD